MMLVGGKDMQEFDRSHDLTMMILSFCSYFTRVSADYANRPVAEGLLFLK